MSSSIDSAVIGRKIICQGCDRLLTKLSFDQEVIEQSYNWPRDHPAELWLAERSCSRAVISRSPTFY